jgi:hypothetical protein
MSSNISNVARILISVAIFTQLFSMHHNKTTRINIFAFLLYGIGATLSSYGYYIEDNHTFQFRFIIKSLNSLMLLLIALYAYSHRRN